MLQTPLSPNQELDKVDVEISPEFTEIGCMCEKYDCKKFVQILTSIYESCLKGKHTSKIDIQFSA